MYFSGRAQRTQSDSGETKLLEMNLFENGLDFIREGVEAVYHYEATKPHAYKYALLHLFSGTLLLLKERLRREHLALIFTKVEAVGKPGANTVDFNTVLVRLETIAQVKFSEGDRCLLKNIQKKRNALEHYEVELQVQHVDCLIGCLVDFIDRFLDEHLGEELGKHVTWMAWDKIREITAIAKRHTEKERQAWLARAEQYFNLADLELERLASVEPFHPRHNPDPVESFTCEQCYEETAVAVERDIAVCTNLACREVVSIEYCPSCEEVSCCCYWG